MDKKCRVVSFFSRKGGTGKTTLAVELMAFAANAGDRVLIIGCDQQEDLTDLFLAGVEEYDPDDHLSLASVIGGECELHEAIIKSAPYACYDYNIRFDGGVFRNRMHRKEYTIDFMPAGMDIAYVNSDDFYFLNKIIEPLKQEYDWIVFDLPPTDSEMSVYVFFCTDYCIIPVTDRASFKSIRMVMDTLNLVRSHGHDIRCLGAVLNMDSNTKSLKKANKQIFMESKDIMFSSTIRDSADISNSAAFAIPVCSYNKTPVQEDLYLVYTEMLARIESEEA